MTSASCAHLGGREGEDGGLVIEWTLGQTNPDRGGLHMHMSLAIGTTSSYQRLKPHDYEVHR